MGDLTFGEELPDQAELLDKRAEAQLLLLQDVRELIRDRVALEREYAGKLQIIARKGAEKKSRHISAVVVGDDPTKNWSEESVKQSTLDKALSQLIQSLESTAQDHISYADALTVKVVDALQAIETRKENSRKKQMQYFTKLVAERDRIYADRSKARQKYYDECNEVEVSRQKQDRARDDKHADRAAKQHEQQKTDMLNAKNTFIISTAIANASKNKFYTVDLPTLENQFQLLQSSITHHLVRIAKASVDTTLAHYAKLSQISDLQAALGAVNERKDQELYINHNRRAFTVPSDLAFEPCPGFYDTAELRTDPEPKVFLQNKLHRSRAKLAELVPVLEVKEREAQRLQALVEVYQKDPSLGDADEVADNLGESTHETAQLSTTRCAYEAEVEVISAVLGDDEGDQHPHTFKSSSFSIPTPCEYCKASIWGLTKQGKTCQGCKISVHTKCELKIPANCGAASRRGPTISRTTTSSSRRTVGELPSSRASVTSTTPSTISHHNQVAEEEEAAAATPSAVVLFDFVSTSPFELSVSEGAQVLLLEEDDGSGWVKIADSKGGKGLVPATYIRIQAQGAQPTRPPPPLAARPTQGSGKFVRGLYEYTPQGGDEIPVRVGGRIELTPNGMDYGNGWWEGIDETGRKGIFPSNYVELI
ncbi:hypothetical protein BOTBODRAFT_27000 [Botryobasidium botryosum FD-172 SS1]|uniref:Uncharacterized protein n=1 Tax=Botryobasidium botryosum (strain FD-172 SS1) TaxID=930990 RepID=A0A067MZE7_BOTB1|nr:hypothetical protein BOTBODRAFT_27000 [Botryobasidium botryosum FD-172 SS1]